jgi:predicted class III extradiol MEMO1 family dioxygenase
MSIHPNKIKVKEYISSNDKKKMTIWEKKFISSLYNKKTEWSSKQIEVFNNIINQYKLTKKPVHNIVIVLPDEPVRYTATINCKQYTKRKSIEKKYK